jgi:hypothetical protein
MPRKYWAEVNDILAGLGQLLVDTKVVSRKRILEIAEKLDKMKRKTKWWQPVTPLVIIIIDSLPKGKESIYGDIEGGDEE